MDYICAAEFLKQPEEVQKVLLDWWKGNCTGNDLVYNNENKKIDIFKNVSGLYCLYPLFTETQLRKFIEEKTGGIVDCAYYNYPENNFKGYTVEVWTDRPYKCIKTFKDLGKDLLQAYWQVVIRIAEEI